MAYSELIKNFDRIRDYVRQFYVYGFKSRTEYDKKSSRSYDNERRRMESWLGDYMGFRQTGEGKHVFLTVDSRSIPGNPLYKAFKAKSFTSGDVTFHFYVLDLLADGVPRTAGQILTEMTDKYLCHFSSGWQPDASTVRKKLKEYEKLGMLKARKQGRDLFYTRDDAGPDLARWQDALAFFSEADPLGVVGSTLLDKLEEIPDFFRFKHHYLLHALDSRLLLALLTAIGERRRVTLTGFSGKKREEETSHTVCPLKIFISTQTGRQYLLCHHYGFKKLTFFRLDFLQTVTPGEPEENFGKYLGFCGKFQSNLWGISTGQDLSLDRVEMTIRIGPGEGFLLQRLEREKRGGHVERLDDSTCRFTAEVYDAMEMLPWIRTFTGRITDLTCTNPLVTERFYGDLDRMAAMYGGETDVVQ